MPGITVTIPAEDLAAIRESAEALGGAAGGEQIKQEMGNAIVQLVRDHFLQLAQDEEHHQSAASLGARPSGFYDRARQGTHDPEIESDGVSISIESEGIAQRLFGGTIEARQGSYLTIPAVAAAYGKSAREFDLRLVIFGDTGLAALVSKDAASPHEGDVYYWLVRSVTQQPDPTVLPEESAMLDAAQANALSYIEAIWGESRVSKIFDTQNGLVNLLTGAPFFQNNGRPIPVFSQRKGNLQQELEANLARDAGLAVVIMLPRISFTGQAQRVTLQLSFAAVVSENPEINQASNNLQIPAEDVTEAVMTTAHWQQNPTAPADSQSQATRYLIDRRGAQMMEPTKKMPSLLNYLITINTGISFP